ncbi:putative XRE-type DNA-binding protein [Bradyrhizobium sp. S3.3.6]
MLISIRDELVPQKGHLFGSACATPKLSTRNRRSPMMSTKKKKLPAHSRGSGNIFADLGLANAQEHQLKAALVVQLKRLMAEREITQTEAARLVGVKQPNLSRMLRGQFRLVSVVKLLRMLTAFRQDVEITVKPHRKRGRAGRITLFRPESCRKGESS